MQQAQGQIDAGLRQARSELKGAAADLAIRAAGKLLGSSLDDATQRRLVEDYIADLERLGSGRKRLTALIPAAGPPPLRSPGSPQTGRRRCRIPSTSPPVGRRGGRRTSSSAAAPW
jgi:hypothetical protein